MDPGAGLCFPPVRALRTRRPNTRLLAFSLVFLTALGIRVHHLNRPPLDFHPIRQYRSAIIARGFFVETQTSIPDWQREVARINKMKEGVLEPPLMELLAAGAYRLVGGEHLWIPKAMAVLFWLGGGLFMFLLARDLISRGAAPVATAIYLFLPYGVCASRSFQPDSLMILLFLACLHAMWRDQLQPSRTRFAWAASLAAAAVLVKPVCLFAILFPFTLMNASRDGWRKAVTSLRPVLFFGATLLPTALFYSYGLFIEGSLRGQAGMSFIPGLYSSAAFWSGWLSQIDRVVGHLTLIAGLLGVMLLRAGAPRAMLVGLWTGYAVFGLAFNYHIHTHDYYHLQLIPIVALSVAPICLMILRGVAEAGARRPWRLALVGVVALASLFYVRDLRWRFGSPDLGQVRIAQEIGSITRHSTKTVFIAWAYGKPLSYHGDIAGEYWPSGEFRLERLEGKKIPTTGERWDSLWARSAPEYFIVTDLPAFESQPELQRLLMDRCRIVERNRDFLIFACGP